MKKSFLQVLFTMFIVVLFGLGNLSGQTWHLVTDASALSAGDQVAIAALDSNFALSTDQRNSNRGATAITKNGDELIINDEVQIFTLVTGTVENTFGFSTDEGYIYAASSSGNQLKTQTTLTANSSFQITIDNTGAFIQAQGNYTRNVLKFNYNSGNPIFSCYASTSTQSPVVIYKLATNVATPTFSLPQNTYYTAQTISIDCATENAAIYYTLDGSTPDVNATLYTEPFTLNTTTTLKAVAFLNDEYSAVATVRYTFPIFVDNIAELREQNVGNTIYALTGNAFVTFTHTDRSAKYIQDATAGILIDDNGGIITGEYNIGDEITGLVGTLTKYKEMLEFVPSVDIPEAVSTGNDIEPSDIEQVEMADYESQLVRLTNVLVDASSHENFEVSTHYALNGNSQFDLYTKYSDLDYLGTEVPVAPQNIVGVVMRYNDVYSIIPRSLADFTENTDVCALLPVLAATDLVEATVNTLEISSSVENKGGDGCNIEEYGFVYSVSVAEPALNTENCFSIAVGEVIAAGTTYTGMINEHVGDSVYVCSYATNGVGTAYGEVLVAYFAVPEPVVITYNVNGQTDFIASEEVLQGVETELPTVDNCNNWEFLGWSETEIARTVAPVAPEVFTTIVPMEDVTLYAVFSMNDGEESDGSYAKVTSELSDWSGTYLMAYVPEASDTIKVFNGIDASHDYVLAETTNGVVAAAVEGQTELFIAPMQGGYSIQVLEGDNANKYLSGTSGSNRLNFNDTPQLNTIVYNNDEENAGTVTITSNTSILRFNKTSGNTNDRFRYYQANNTSYPFVSLYKKSGGNTVYATDITDTTYIYATICDGDSYTENGFNESEAGTYVNVVPNGSAICFDIYKLTLDVVIPTIETPVEITACGSYTWDENGETYYASGNYELHILSAGGCDSVVRTLSLTINHGDYVVVDALDTCMNENDTYTWSWLYYQLDCAESGTYTIYATNDNGCMDTIVRDININRIKQTQIEATICDGEIYTENGFNVNEEGTYTQTLSTVGGCDSIVTLTLHVGSARMIDLQDEVCMGNGYSNYDFEIAASELPNAGVYEFSRTIVRPGSCDSIVNLSLTVLANSSTDIYETACGSYTWNLNGEVYTESTDATVVLQNAVGCDSTVVLHLTILQPINHSFSDEACETYTWNGETYQESGEYTQTFTAANGCDSVVTLTLTIHESIIQLISEEACGSYTWNDQTYNESGEYTQSFTTVNGCDSTVTLTLTIDEMPEIEIAGNTEISVGESTTLSVDDNDSWSYSWSTGETTSEIEVAPEETTEYTVTVLNGACVTTATATVVVSVGIQDYNMNAAHVYPNPADQYCMIQAPNMQTVHIYNMNGQKVASFTVAQNDSYRLETETFVPGTYFVQIITNDNQVITSKLVVKH